MLVLSRRPQQKVLFPNLGVSVEIVSVQGQVVRIGVNAPRDVAVWREEIAPKGEIAEPKKPSHHRLRNQLNHCGMALHLAQRQLQVGMNSDAEHTLQDALAALQELDKEWLGAASPQEAAKAEATRRGVQALLVEDNRNESALLASYLRLNGIQVETADDGDDALAYLASHNRPDVVLLDMRLPRCDGPSTIAAIRGNPSLEGLKVFAVTGATQSEYGIPTGPGGVDRWFTKPLNPMRLVEEVAGIHVA